MRAPSKVKTRMRLVFSPALIIVFWRAPRGPLAVKRSLKVAYREDGGGNEVVWMIWEKRGAKVTPIRWFTRTTWAGPLLGESRGEMQP